MMFPAGFSLESEKTRTKSLSVLRYTAAREVGATSCRNDGSIGEMVPSIRA